MKNYCIKNIIEYNDSTEKRLCAEGIIMIIEIRANNCYSFEEPVALSLQADMRNKKFASNVHTENQFHVLKTAGIY